MNKVICESMLHMVGQTQYVEQVLQGVVRVDSVYWRKHLQGQRGKNPSCSKMKQLGHDSAG